MMKFCALIGMVGAKLVIHSPQKLVDLFKQHGDGTKPGLIKASYANFGLIPYGHSMVGKLFFDERSDIMCQKDLKSNEDFDKHLHDDQKEKKLITPFMIADRGGCSFVTKVRNMQNLGAAVAIVVDNTEENVENIVMSDDGTGAGIRIPSMLISKKDGLKLIDFMKTATVEELNQISINAKFDMSRPDNRVEYDIWYSSANDVALDFFHDFMKVDKKFGDQVLMTPRLVFWECLNCETEFIRENCFAGGKYCATDSGNSRLTGQEIILEDLRQMCIYKQAYFEDENRQMFWDYMKVMHSECDQKLNEECSMFVGHKKVKGLDWKKTQECVENSFVEKDQNKRVNEVNTNNTLIDKDIAYWAKYGSNLFPSIVINNSTYRGQIETQAVMNAICAGFQDPPKMCKRILHKNLEYDFGLGVQYFDDGYKPHHILGIFLIFTFGLFITLCCYRRHAKRQMKQIMSQQIETAVNHYVSLGQKDPESTQSEMTQSYNE